MKLLLSIKDENLQIDTNYNSFKLALKTYQSVFKFILKNMNKYFNFILHYLHLFFVKLFSRIIYLFEYLYAALRDSFVKKSVKNKNYVKHFWEPLKEFKKEMDTNINISDEK